MTVTVAIATALAGAADIHAPRQLVWLSRIPATGGDVPLPAFQLHLDRVPAAGFDARRNVREQVAAAGFRDDLRKGGAQLVAALDADELAPGLFRECGQKGFRELTREHRRDLGLQAGVKIHQVAEFSRRGSAETHGIDDSIAASGGVNDRLP